METEGMPKLQIRGEWTNWGDGGYVIEVEDKEARGGLRTLWAIGVRRTDVLREVYSVKEFRDDSMEGKLLGENKSMLLAHRIAYTLAVNAASEFEGAGVGSKAVDKSPYNERRDFFASKK